MNTQAHRSIAAISLPIDKLEPDWRRMLGGPLLRSRFAHWQACEPALAQFDDAKALIGCLRNQSVNIDRDAVLCALLRQAGKDPIAGQVVLVAILPGMKNLAGRVLVDAREREELWSALLACAWELIRSYPVQRRPRRVAANLLLDCLRQTLRALAGARPQVTSFASRALAGPDPFDTDERDVDALLAEATAAGAISSEEAELILATRIDGVLLSVLARSQRVRFDTLKHRRYRAERRLLVFLGYRPVPQRGVRRPFSLARVAGAGPSGLAGGYDQSNQ